MSKDIFNAQAIIRFWFSDIEQKFWWKKNPQFDAYLKHRFGRLHQQAVLGELAEWRDTAQGRLAEVIILDQFSRNIYRDKSQAFAADSMALALSQEAVRLGADDELTQQQCIFLYMPYMHSESPAVHEQAVELFTKLGRPGNLDFELRHKVIIDQFGRYPHRNKILGRPSTAEEKVFLSQPGSSF
ncbi:MAG: DUF924 family protein [Kangiellaceae bacterium]|jgi:uncharacterized protein (DUF924 family)|nr:DUF924 family protein [Kangiellaceae bacterium]